VPNVLRVAAFEVGDPIAGIVLVESDNLAIRARGGCRFM
jgi:hypothetical protein